MDNKEESRFRKLRKFLLTNKWKIFLGLMISHITFPIWNYRSWLIYYIRGKYLYEKNNPVSLEGRLITLRGEITELLRVNNFFEFGDEFFDVLHVMLLYITTLIKIPLLDFLLPSLARPAAIKCARRFFDNNCLRSINNCRKGNHVCTSY